jgi:transposase-like protein
MSSLGERLEEEINRLGGVSSLANALGIARNTLYNWVSKENIPANKLVEIAGAGADIAYVITGVRSGAAKLEAQGEAADGAVDLERLEMVMRVLDEALTKYRRVLDPDKKAKVIALLYQLAGQPGYASATAEKMLELVD